jgi:hypothetical protein
MPADFMTEINDWLLFVTGLEQSQLFRGYQSREVLPADGAFVIYTPILQRRIGTNISTLYADGVDADKNAPNVDSKLLQIDVQIDCYGDDSFSLAETIETFAGSLSCNDWLRQQGFIARVNYASSPTNATLVDETRQYVERWTVVLTVTATADFEMLLPWLEDVTVEVIDEKPPEGEPPIKDKKGDKLINIDSVFPPN